MDLNNQTNDLEIIKPTRKNRTRKWWKTIKPNLNIFTIWFLFALPLNFVTTIRLYYLIIEPASYMMMTKILCVIIANTIISAIIYFFIIFLKNKFKHK